MNENTVIFFLSAAVAALFFVILYQRYKFKKDLYTKLRQITEKLSEILETGSDEKVMVFTDNKALIGLVEQIDRLLEDRQKIKVDFKRAELSSKKMLSNISHDIKTPLTVILGYLEIMRLDNEDDEALKKVEIKAKQVMELIGQFFTLAKLEAGDADIPISRLNINEVCRENVLDFYDILLQKRFTVDVDIPEKPIYVLANKEAVQRILFNLLSNAIRYGSDGNYLGISLREDEKHVFINITDKGRGIDKKSAAHVFERLYTMEDSRNREIQGNGLGLTIAKNLAVQMEGDLFLDSAPDVKTTFTLMLRKADSESFFERNS
ncbi:sensor histidine kinase [Qiania dongpingensis]|uniref:histidine kinase n=1 Tax=Qiania dongpingensis TaxID=2763669 RepID=A0A7G9G3K6_9FIRM|nr:sensor histidine kinase [Qiania dongpingensis]QNM05388.1 sensor histidine kinase [Qiania dongpingensis]